MTPRRFRKKVIVSQSNTNAENARELGEKGRYSPAPARSQYHARPSLRSKRFRLVSEQNKTEEQDFWF